MIKYSTGIICILFIVITVSACSEQQASSESQPNIVILLADDLGYGDLNSYGGVANTPNLDKLSQQGLTFSDFYAPAPNCSPSRAGLLTGRNPNRIGIYSYRPPGSNMHLKDEEITIAELLKQEGYQTAMFGKWHLSDLKSSGEGREQPSPADQGFDYWLATENNAQPSHYNPVNFVRNGTTEDTLEGYSAHILAREANKWLGQLSDSSPFFLYIPFHEVHKKIASPDSLIEKYGQYEDAEYLANVENLDAAVGVIIQKLEDMDKFQNTLIIFSSDNGSYRYGSNGNLRGFKGESFEGGVRVPGISHWPEKIKSARTVSAPAGLIDLLPTISELTDASMPDDRTLDGVSLAPVFDGQKLNRQKPLLWFFYRAYPELGMRDGKYALNASARDPVARTHYFSQKDMSFINQLKLKEFKLYNIEDDPLQKKDISKNRPMLHDSLMKKSRNLFKGIIEEGPYWKNLPGFNSQRAKQKRSFMRNKEARWDMGKENN